jgi:hypothetical protein
MVALLNFEFDLADKITKHNPREVKVEKRIDVVTFGNPVDLPDQHEMMKTLFHYHQFAGTNDLLMALNSSKTLISKILMEGKVHPNRPFDPSEDPDVRLFEGCRHKRRWKARSSYSIPTNPAKIHTIGSTSFALMSG